MGKIVVGILWLVSAVLTLGYTWQAYTSTYNQFPDSGSGGGLGTAIGAAGASRYLLEKKGQKTPSDNAPTDEGKGTSGDGETPKGTGGGSLWDWAKNLLGWGKSGGGGGTATPEAPPIELP